MPSLYGRHKSNTLANLLYGNERKSGWKIAKWFSPPRSDERGEGEKSGVRLCGMLYERKIKLRPSCAGLTTPHKANADVEHMIAIIGIVIDSLEFIPKPLIPIAEI